MKKNNKKINWKKLNIFANMDSSLKKIVLTWVCIVIFFVVVILASNMNNKFLSKHETIENDLTGAALYYMEKENLFSPSNSKMKIDLDLLLESGYFHKSNLTDKSCKGYALGYYDEDDAGFKAKSYISCKHYTTKDFGK